jgi:hypothetical protein
MVQILAARPTQLVDRTPVLASIRSISSLAPVMERAEVSMLNSISVRGGLGLPMPVKARSAPPGDRLARA